MSLSSLLGSEGASQLGVGVLKCGPPVQEFPGGEREAIGDCPAGEEGEVVPQGGVGR